MCLSFAPVCKAAPPSSLPMAEGPSFSCASPSPIEAVICADPDLAARDRTMAELFAVVRRNAFGTGPSNALAEQRKWLKDRETDCGREQPKQACVREEYDIRLIDLAVSALFTSHDAALAELKRQSPQQAQVYEAIYQYATAKTDEERVRVVAPLIAPAFETIRFHPAQDVLGVGHVGAFAEPRLKDIATPEAAASSDANFDRFLYAAVGWYVRAAGQAVMIPCAALVRRPGLLDVLSERFAPSTDCAAMLPPTPNLDRLVASAVAVQPPCQGTIRIDLGALYHATLLSIRLHRERFSDRRRTTFFSKVDLGEDEAAFRRRHGGELRSASAEMAAYYQTNFGLAPAFAKAEGLAVADLAVSDAFHLCE